ncbi:MAG: YIP1 family protein [Pseudomonadota bacterium]
MPVTTDILASYRRPRSVMARLLSGGADDRVAFAYLTAGLMIGFISQLPGLMRQANEPNPEFEAAIRAEAGDVRPIESVAVPADIVDAKFEALMSGALMAWIFILPLLFYGVAALSLPILRAMGAKIDGLGARLALFWAFLAAIPLKLFQGLVAGFIGPGPVLIAAWLIWLLVFVWFWASNLKEAGWGS